MSIFITGDTHRELIRFQDLHTKKLVENDYLVICGDFGFIWDNSESENNVLDYFALEPYNILFIDGNHENFDILNSLPVEEWHGGKVHFIRPNIIHLMRGQVFNIEDYKFFTMGGARSHDIQDGILEVNEKEKIARLIQQQKCFRINHQSWWREEMPTKEEYEEALKNLEKHNNKVDFIISHCAPSCMLPKMGIPANEADELTDFLNYIDKIVDFKGWFFGHYHQNWMLDDKHYLLYTAFEKLEQLIKI